MFIFAPFHLTYFRYFSIEEKKAEKKSQRNKFILLTKERYKHSSLTLHNIICVRLIDQDILETILNRRTIVLSYSQRQGEVPGVGQEKIWELRFDKRYVFGGILI